MKQLLEAGVHFGHQTRRWNPKMAPYIYGERNGIHIIDLRQTVEQVRTSIDYVRDLVADGGVLLFVGTKKQAASAVAQAAEHAGMPYVNYRWLGGMLTNFNTIQKRIFYMKELERMEESGEMQARHKKERLRLRRELEKLQANLGGVAEPHAGPGCHLRRRREQRADRRQRGAALGHQGHGARRLELRSRPRRSRDPGQRRRDPLRRADRNGARRRQPRRSRGLGKLAEPSSDES